MVSAHPSGFIGFLPLFLYFLLDFAGWNHTYVDTDSQGFFGWYSIAMECPAIPKNEITSLGVELHIVDEGFVQFFLFWNQIPVVLAIKHLLLFKVFVVIMVSSRHHYKPTTILTGVCQIY